ncbi:MAG TPA: hypothetical protein VHQ01_11525, partial [Pyrinomonadaceae bacterium]|nr:hypothetical protein [Pyrinomonadaceae bacterium]
MKKYLYVVIAFVLIFPSARLSQGQKPITKPAAEKLDAKFPGYTFEVRVGADKTSQIEIRTSYEYQDLDNGQLRKALSEYLLMQSPGIGHKPVGPIVSVWPDESLDMQTVVDVIKTVRVSRSADVTLATLEGPKLDIPVDPKFVIQQVVKPNPLYLIVVANEKKGLTLNNDEYGSVADPSRLISKLKAIFHEREINGVTQENSFDIEKTVTISIAPTAKFKNL